MTLDPPYREVVDRLEALAEAHLAQVRKIREAIALLAEVAASPATLASTSSLFSPGDDPLRRTLGGRFNRMPLRLAVTRLLLRHGSLPAEVIHRMLVEGGYQFEVPDPERQLQSLRISLGKLQFRKTEEGEYRMPPAEAADLSRSEEIGLASKGGTEAAPEQPPVDPRSLPPWKRPKLEGGAP